MGGWGSEAARECKKTVDNCFPSSVTEQQREVHPPRTLWVLGFERSKHSRTTRKDKPCFYYSLFYHIRYEQNNNLLFCSAHVIRSKNGEHSIRVFFFCFWVDYGHLTHQELLRSSAASLAPSAFVSKIIARQAILDFLATRDFASVKTILNRFYLAHP